MPVYILSDRPNNRLKIGYTANLPKRLQTHRTSNPGLEVVAVLEEGDRNAEVALESKNLDKPAQSSPSLS
jgi:predicted GIY-YIG superfamily endonuclease